MRKVQGCSSRHCIFPNVHIYTGFQSVGIWSFMNNLMELASQLPNLNKATPGGLLTVTNYLHFLPVKLYLQVISNLNFN